jgi:hypothetical protein
MRQFSLLSLLAGLFWAIAASAAPLAPADAPKPLQPWVSWVLHGDKEYYCPFDYNGPGGADSPQACHWPARLNLELTDQGGEFSQEWTLYGEGWLSLPGSAKHWPQEVKVNEKKQVVTDRGGVPSVFLSAGLYVINGKFAWDKRPEFLQVPATTGLLNLRLNGQPVAIPELDEEGRLWLRQRGEKSDEAAEEDRLQIEVFRHALDDIPLRLTTRLELDVAGQAREVLLGPAVGADYTPMTLDSPLPARLEADGRLRVQVRRGSWAITLAARHQGETKQIAAPKAENAEWPEEEVWVFAAQNHLRMVQVSGAASVDPQQTGLPQEWRGFPAYLLKTGESLQLEEKRRGDPEPAPDQLSLQRRFWLDFDGGGYTVQDRVSGSMSRSWRLDMAEPNLLGRVAVDNQDQLITHLADGAAGIEVRQGRISLSADSRIDQPLRRLPAVGWKHDFQSVSAAINLPPGWRLWHVSGVDEVPGTWLQRWNLFNLFIVLMVAAAMGKLWGWRWGGLALAALLLSWHEAGAAQFLWLNLLGVIALLLVLPQGRWFTAWARWYRNLSVLALLIVVIPFLVAQARQALYPQLEYPWNSFLGPAHEPVGGMGNGFANDAAPMPPATAPMAKAMPESAGEAQIANQAPQQMQMDEEGYLNSFSRGAAGKQSYYGRADKSKEQVANMRRNLAQIDPKAQVQTGPGLPVWNWKQVRLIWSGPVQADQQVRFYLTSPGFNQFLGLLRIVLIAALTGFFLALAFGCNHCRQWLHGLQGKTTGAASMAAVFGLTVLLAGFLTPGAAEAGEMPQPQAADNQDSAIFPPPALLDELKNRLSNPPECLPYCAAIARMEAKIKPDALHLKLEIHAEVNTALPLPGGAAWWPNQVWIDGAPAQALIRSDGQLWLNVPQGVHEIGMDGPLPNRATVQLPLPLLPRHVAVKAEGWQVEGVHEDGVADAQLQFSRDSGASAAEMQDLEIGTLPPFVEIERVLLLGLDWQAQTTVRRLTATDTAIVLEVPLLPGESVTSENPRVQAGKALINMAADETEFTWESILQKQDSLQLTAPANPAWREVWKLDASAIWHVETGGIPMIHHQDSEGRWLPEWRPWPGESVSLALSRPAAIAGQIMTIDSSELKISPGQRATDTRLKLRLRSSQGGQHRLTLPEGAELQEIKINNASQPIRPEGRILTIPVTPGTQNIDLLFRQADGISVLQRTPPLDVGIASVNSHIEMEVPRGRWVLLAGGPALGPAVLFWGLLAVVILAALGLGRVPLTPLKTWEWALLGIVLIQADAVIAILVAGWLLALGWRGKLKTEVITPWRFAFLQTTLAGLTLAALAALLVTLEQGLTGQPDMQILGNRSSYNLLRWYQDRSAAALPQAWMLSVPLLFYRALMLAWALWLAFALLRWLRWGWQSFSAGEVWKPLEWRWPWRKKKPLQTGVDAG